MGEKRRGRGRRRLQRKKPKLRRRHDLQLKLSDNKKRQPGQRLRGRSNRKPSLK